MNLKRSILAGIAVILLFLVVRKCDDVIDSCPPLRLVKGVEFNGVIDSLYIDKENHSYPMISFAEDWKDYYIPKYELSGFYSFLKPGDRVVKSSGNVDVVVIRNRDTSTFTLQYECPQADTKSDDTIIVDIVKRRPELINNGGIPKASIPINHQPLTISH